MAVPLEFILVVGKIIRGIIMIDKKIPALTNILENMPICSKEFAWTHSLATLDSS